MFYQYKAMETKYHIQYRFRINMRPFIYESYTKAFFIEALSQYQTMEMKNHT